MKKVLSIALCMVMLITTISAIPTSAKIIFTSHNSFYEETDNTDTHYYKIIDGVYYVIIDQYCDNYGYVAAILPPKETKKVEILDEISFGGETVEISAIDIEKQYRFSNMNSSLEELVIGNIQYVKGINFIPSLRKVTFTGDARYIEDCFYGCENLETIEGKAGYKIEDGAIYNSNNCLISILDSSLTSFEVKKGTTSVLSPFGTYLNVTLKSLNINENLDVLETGKMKKLNTITFGENVTKIKKIDLNGVRNLKNLDLSKIEVNSFYAKGVWHIKSVSFGKIKKLLKHSFRGCKKIETIKFKENIPKIYKNAFKNKKAGIKFYVNNKEDAKLLEKRLKNSGAKNPKIYIGEKLYK